jgi:hypothetical protein
MDNQKHLGRGLLSPVLDWTPEQRAAAEPEPESNVIYLADYKPQR